MRKLFKKIVLSFIVFGFISCSNDDSNIPKQSNFFNSSSNSNVQRMSSAEIEDTFNKIVSLNDTNEQILAASTLSPEDKLSLWIYKLENFKENNSLTSEQINFINSLISELNQNLFDEKSNLRIEFLQNRSDEIMQNAKNLFGEKEGWYLLTKVENINHRIARINALNEIEKEGDMSKALRSCTCESSSECVRVTGISVWWVSWEYGTCGGNCYTRTYFFGLWESDNTGRCKY